jgi:hypothetical protein
LVDTRKELADLSDEIPRSPAASPSQGPLLLLLRFRFRKPPPPPDWWPSVIQHPDDKRLRMLLMLSIQSQLTGKWVIAPLDKIAESACAEGLSDLDHPEMVRRVLKGLRTVLKLVSKASASPRRAAVYEFRPPPVGPQAPREVEDALCARTERRAPAQLQGVT